MTTLQHLTRAECYALARLWLLDARRSFALAVAARTRHVRTHALGCAVEYLAYAAEWRDDARRYRRGG